MRQQSQHRYDSYSVGGYDLYYEDRYYREKAAGYARRKRRRRRAASVFFAVLIVLLICSAAVFVFSGGGFREAGYPAEAPIQTVQDYSVPEATPEAGAAEKTDVLRYRGSLLSGDELGYYEKICSAVAYHETSIKFSSSDVDRLMAIAQYVYYDYPEYFWFDGKTSARFLAVGNRNIGELSFEYLFSAEETEYRKERIRSLTAEVVERLSGASDYDKVRGVYEYIINSTEYSGSVRDQSCYSVLAEGRGVCAGYASAFDYLMKRLGVDCIHVSGVSRGENHAWNIVKVEGQWYQVDCTWGDPVIDDGTGVLSYDYLLLTDAEMGKDHTPASDIVYPVCNSIEYNFYIREGLYLVGYSVDTVAEIAGRCAYSGRSILMKCADAGVYEETVRKLFDRYSGDVFRILRKAGFGTDETVNYTLDPEHLTVEIFA